MLDVADEFGIVRTYSMCPPDDIPPLRERFGDRLGFNGSITKKSSTSRTTSAYRLLDRFLELGVEIIKFWAAPRGRERGLFVDAPWRIEAARRARAAGVRIVMVHVADPDVWFRTIYADAAKFGTKPDQYVGLERHAGDVPRPDLDRRPHGRRSRSIPTTWKRCSSAIRTSASRHQRHQVAGARGVGPPRGHPRADLPASDALPVRLRPGDARTACRASTTSAATGASGRCGKATGRAAVRSPTRITRRAEASRPRPPLRGLDLPADVLEQVYHGNACGCPCCMTAPFPPEFRAE